MSNANDTFGGLTGYSDVGQGSPATARFSRQSGLLTSDIAGKYSELSRSEKVFGAANSALTAWTVGLATTYTGLVVWNPAASGVNLVMLSVGFAHGAAPSTLPVIGLLGSGAITTTDIVTNGAALTPFCTYLTGGIGKGRASAGCTLTSTPVYLVALFSSPATGTLPVGGNPALIDLNGMFTVPPGAFIGLSANTVATGFGSFTWTEVPV
jgi:hypothetical protein